MTDEKRRLEISHVCFLAAEYKDKYRGFLQAALKDHPWPEAVRQARADLVAWGSGQ